MAAKAVFQGDGAEFVGGVPARDLDASEYEALTDEQRVAVLSTRDRAGRQLYRVAGATAEREALRLVEPVAEPAPRRRRAPEAVEPVVEAPTPEGEVS